MMICKVIGHVWATKKKDALVGMKLVVVRELDAQLRVTGTPFVAADSIGAGVEERVLVVSGSTARVAAGDNKIPVDAAIVGIIDSLEVDREQAGGKK